MFELKEYSKDVIDVASSWLGIKHPVASSVLTSLKLMFDLPTKIVMHKLCRILSKQEPDFFEWLKISENFDKDATNYNTTVRQLILCINAINEEALFDVYANLMRSWQLGLGSYNPDWAVLIEKGGEQKLYFVLETKGNVQIEFLRPAEYDKIMCGYKHFEALGNDVVFKPISDFDEFIENV